MNAMHPQRCDSPSIHRDYFELTAWNGNAIAHLRKTAQSGERISAKRGPVALGNLYAMIGAHVDE